MNAEIALEDKTKLIRLLEALLPGVRIYLYGSRARGMGTHHSDIDLAVLSDKPIGRRALAEARTILNETYMPYTVDIVDLKDISSDFYAEIRKDMIQWN